MFQLFRARRGRKAAIAAIAPHVEASRHRLDGISDENWLEPYMVGFISCLITSIARRVAGPLGTHAMGLVQMEAWAEITGLDAELVGEEICLLCSVQDQDFAEGCRSASAFLAEQSARGEDGDADPELSALWASFFDSHIAKCPGDGSWVHERRQVAAKAGEGRS